MLEKLWSDPVWEEQRLAHQTDTETHHDKEDNDEDTWEYSEEDEDEGEYKGADDEECSEEEAYPYAFQDRRDCSDGGHEMFAAIDDQRTRLHDPIGDIVLRFCYNMDIEDFEDEEQGSLRCPSGGDTLARVSQLIVVNALGYKITLGSSTASTLDQKLKETTSAGGSSSVFGIPISLGGSGSCTEENQAHKASWDSASNTFTITPIINNNCATVVGLAGECFNLA
ncbi:hypothetical protein QQZ08_009511 [Neonectria magnoliae]|uniref:Uncharacterized protein n=1 Tax=Neonectria magnoliae TaxID=2732573 RepID=A0ABR1HNB1_9HYPO